MIQNGTFQSSKISVLTRVSSVWWDPKPSKMSVLNGVSYVWWSSKRLETPPEIRPGCCRIFIAGDGRKNAVRIFDNFVFRTSHARVGGCWGICGGVLDSPYRVAIGACCALPRVLHTLENETKKTRTNLRFCKFQEGTCCDVWFVNRIQRGTPSFHAFRSTVVGIKMRQSGWRVE